MECFYNPNAAPFVVNGVLQDPDSGRYLRMPAAAAERVSPAVAELNRHTAGGRVRFKTDAKSIAIKCVQSHRLNIPHMTQTAQSGFSLYADNAFFRAFIPPYEKPESYGGFEGEIVFFDNKLRDITIYFPSHNEVRELYVGLNDGCRILPPDEYKIRKPVLFYGSSITQGGCASRPGNTYAEMVCRRLNADFINLGFSGSAKGEPAMGEYLGSLDVSLFVLDYDHNAPDAGHLQKTHYPFYKLYRKLRPDTPVIMMSKPDFDSDRVANAKRRQVIIDTFNKGKAEGDKNLYFIDGETLFGNIRRDDCTVDGCHPNDVGFERMADTVFQVMKPIFDGRFL